MIGIRDLGRIFSRRILIEEEGVQAILYHPRGAKLNWPDMTMWNARTGISGRYFNSFKINKYKRDHMANCRQKLFVKKHRKKEPAMQSGYYVTKI